MDPGVAVAGGRRPTRHAKSRVDPPAPAAARIELSLDAELYGWLSDLAHRHDRSRAFVVVRAAQRYFEIDVSMRDRGRRNSDERGKRKDVTPRITVGLSRDLFASIEKEARRRVRAASWILMVALESLRADTEPDRWLPPP